MIRTVYIAILVLMLSGCILTSNNVAKETLTGDEPIAEKTLKGEPISKSSGILSTASSRRPADLSLTINQFKLFYDGKGRITWDAPDGLTYFLDPKAAKPNYWLPAFNKDGDMMMAYYWSDTGNIDSLLALSIEGANSYIASLAYSKTRPNDIFYLGVGDGKKEPWNRLGRPAAVLRSIGKSKEPPISEGEELYIVTTNSVNQNIAVEKLDKKVKSFVNNLAVKTYTLHRSEHDIHEAMHPNRDVKINDVYIGCDNAKVRARALCGKGYETNVEAIFDVVSTACGNSHYEVTCLKKPY